MLGHCLCQLLSHPTVEEVLEALRADPHHHHLVTPSDPTPSAAALLVALVITTLVGLVGLAALVITTRPPALPKPVMLTN